jgi:hypothetical protein
LVSVTRTPSSTGCCERIGSEVRTVGLLDVAPVKTKDNRAGVHWRNAKLRSQGLVTRPLCRQAPQLAHIRLRQLRLSRLLTARLTGSSPNDHLRQILGHGANRKVTGVDACRIVAGVLHHQTSGDRTVGDLVGHPMGAICARPGPEAAVAGCLTVSSPRPAGIRRSTLDLRPKSQGRSVRENRAAHRHKISQAGAKAEVRRG